MPTLHIHTDKFIFVMWTVCLYVCMYDKQSSSSWIEKKDKKQWLEQRVAYCFQCCCCSKLKGAEKWVKLKIEIFKDYIVYT